MHILVMNSEDPNRSDKNSDQYKFAQSDLQAAHNNSNIKWIIVEVHQPFFASPNGCSASSAKEANLSHRHINRYLIDNKVDLVLFGHVHNYERTFPVVFNSADPLNPTKQPLHDAIIRILRALSMPSWVPGAIVSTPSMLIIRPISWRFNKRANLVN